MEPLRQQQSYASRPGNLDKIDFWLWARCFPVDTAIPLVSIAILVLFAIGVPVVGGTHVLPGLIVIGVIAARLYRILWRRYIRVGRQFRGGCICAAQVVSVRPYLIAVSSDLSKTSQESWPIIKIIKQPLGRVPGANFQIGDRLVTVALYHNSPPSMTRWLDFTPIAAVCVTADRNALAEMRASLDDDPNEWQQLEENLARVATPRKPGFYLMRDPNS